MNYAAVRSDGVIQFVCHGADMESPPEHPEFTYIPVEDGFAPEQWHVVDGVLVYGALDRRTLDEVKAQQWESIKQSRSHAEYSGFTWDGSPFDSDAVSQARINGAVSLALMSTEFSIVWTLADNTTRALNQTDMMQVGAALGTHVAEQFAKGVALREQINAATTKEEVEAVTWQTMQL